MNLKVGTAVVAVVAFTCVAPMAQPVAAEVSAYQARDVSVAGACARIKSARNE
ncbi:MAG: hypothetical protein AB7F94_16735 [Nitrospira sp.]